VALLLQRALCTYAAHYPDDDPYKEVFDALELRLSRTQCQPGGCEYCDSDARAERYDSE
jgi:hypothetical protein